MNTSSTAKDDIRAVLCPIVMCKLRVQKGTEYAALKILCAEGKTEDLRLVTSLVGMMVLNAVL